ncbi:MAG: hypothetical protein B6226_01405 [Candidatus Cloacimonetes bacterium 4572_65]|nr:MAG: hypothetical protein B6226_01405 [Candidatus Cloacimonetes bacterium 4572_65]
MKSKIALVVLTLIFALELLALPISVSIVGNVDNPGVYIFDSNNRVSQAIQFIELQQLQDISYEIKEATALQSDNLNEAKLGLADDKSTQLVAYNNQKKLSGLKEAQKIKEELNREDFSLTASSSRRVFLLRGEETIELNLNNFFMTGDLNDNPYLLDNDIIRLIPIESKIFVEGEVHREGEFEILKGDRISDVLEFSLGLKPAADLNRVLLYRYAEGSSNLITIELDIEAILENSNSESNILVLNDDRVVAYEKPVYHQKKSITIKGCVNYPGEYIIDANSTLLSVLECAGGPTAEADLNFALLIDKSNFDSYDPDLERLMSLNITTMSISEYSYYQTKLREISGQHYVNIEKLWSTKDSKYNRAVQDGDIIYIRRPALLVNVSGAVNTAGLQPWKAGLTWEEYIRNADGITSTALLGKVKIIRYKTGVWVNPKKDTVVNGGDEIFVPERKDLSTWDYVLEGLAVTAQVITIVLGVHTLTK